MIVNFTFFPPDTLIAHATVSAAVDSWIFNMDLLAIQRSHKLVYREVRGIVDYGLVIMMMMLATQINEYLKTIRRWAGG